MQALVNKGQWAKSESQTQIRIILLAQVSLGWRTDILISAHRLHFTIDKNILGCRRIIWIEKRERTSSLPYHSPITAPSLILRITSVTTVAPPRVTTKTAGTMANADISLPYFHTRSIST